jgi:uncharacterized protein (TIGR03437 family)
LNTTDTPAAPGDALVVYLTGQGALDNPVPTGSPALGSPLSRPSAPSSVTIGGKDAPLSFIGLTPGQISLVQANVTVPDLEPGEHAVVVTIGGQRSNGPVITVGPRR